ncbi:hypothetical protein CHUAL_011873 [Chamberlinius hualienensis]
MTLKMIDSEENGKLVESIYKNILDKFEPGARQLITAGKAYLKALQGASTAAKQYMEAVSRLAKQAQQGTWDATSDIGSTLLQFTDVYREIHQQHHHILKAFYVDVLVPLETNLEKDTKVIQNEQKKFQQQLRLRQDNYQKAIGIMKKQRKKTRTSRSSSNLEKELKNMQCLEDEKAKLDGFCEESLRNALTQERIRYGFVLERQCSLAKHHLAYHSKGEKLLQRHLDEWHEVVKTRDFLPEHIQVMFGNGERPPPPPSSSLSNGLYGIQQMIPNGHLEHNLEEFFSDDHEDTLSMTLRKARSMDASSMDLRSLSEAIDPPDMGNGPPGSLANTSTMTRAKSDFNLSSSHQSLNTKDTSRPRSMMVPNDDSSSNTTTTSTTTTVATTVMAINNNRKKRPMSRALYSYLSSGEHQLSFHEGDSILIIGERNKGWQYGENLRTRRSGWFPVAYTQMITDDENEDDHTPTTSPRKQRALITSSTFVNPTLPFDPFSMHYPQSNRTIPNSTSWSSQSQQTMRKMNWGTVTGAGYSRGDLGPPPPPPPPMPPGATISSNPLPHNHDIISGLTNTHSYSPEPELRSIHRSLTSPAPLRIAANSGIMHSVTNHNNSNMAATSLHSSNDSGFCNEINLTGPHQPEPDYCDDSSSNELSNRENVFSTVKLRKTKTNDRSAPKIS